MAVNIIKFLKQLAGAIKGEEEWNVINPDSAYTVL